MIKLSRLPMLFLLPWLAAACGTVLAQAPASDATRESAADELQEDSSRPSVETASNGKVAGPRELLELYGIDASHFARLADGRPWEDAEDEILMKIFYRLRNVRLIDLQRWGLPLDRAELISKPDAHRGEVYRIEGRAVSLDILRPLPEIVERLGLSRYYRVELELPEGQRATVFAREIPDAWTKTEELNEPAAALGFFLKVGGTEDTPEPVFIAKRIAWYPKTLLGNLGMDVGLLDQVWQEEMAGGPGGTGKGIDVRKLRLTGNDRDAFYEMLAAVGHAEPGQLIREAQRRLAATGRDSYSVVPLFNQPKTQLGQLVVLTGNARRIARIRIEDEEIRSRLGMDHYYEIYLFTDDSQGNPLVFCVRELPPGMPTEEGPQFGVTLTIAGFFFKTWAYRRTAQEASGKAEWQLAPLLIGREPVWIPQPPSRPDPRYEIIAGGIFLLALAGLGLLVWYYNRSDRKARKYTIGRQLSPEGGPSLGQLDQSADAKPDFSRLDDSGSGTSPQRADDSP